MEKNSLLNKINLFLMRLSSREQWALGGGSVVILLLIGYFMIIDPITERMEQLDDLIPRKEKSLRELLRLKDDYLSFSKEIKVVEGRLPASGVFSPLSFLEEKAAKNQIRKQIAFIRPLTPKNHLAYREIPVEVKVENVTLRQIIPFLTAVEKTPHWLRIKRLSIKTRFSNPDIMDVTFLVLSYEKASS
ncbi:MAG: type II secretion system protein GspM [Nitrospiria bacterium]